MADSCINSEQLPWLTADLPGVGGVIKRYDEDFLVEELPLYEASGQGTHCYFTIEKRGLTTPAAIRRVAAALNRKPRDIGYAGLKDAHGVARQRLSVEHVDPEVVASLELDRIRVSSVTLHTNKLKLGHLCGNRFRIRVRGALASPLEAAAAVLDRLVTRGVPNFFGPQRFGVRGDNAVIGRAVLREDYDEAVSLMLGRPQPIDRGAALEARELFESGDWEASMKAWPPSMQAQRHVCRAWGQSGGDARKAWRAVDHSMRKLYLFAVQSELFNQVLARRIESLDRLETGDLAWKHRNGACFMVEDAVTEQPRCDAFEISPTGPLFGKKMTEPSGGPGEMEAAVLEASGLEREQIRMKDAGKLDGARRPLRVPLSDSALEAGEDDRGGYLQVVFSLPPGAYATSVVREICKRVESGEGQV